MTEPSTISRDRTLAELRVHALRLKLLAVEVEHIGVLLANNHINHDGALALWADLWARHDLAVAA